MYTLNYTSTYLGAQVHERDKEEAEIKVARIRRADIGLRENAVTLSQE